MALEGKRGHAFIAPVDVLLPKSGEADEQVDTVVQPDVFIVCDLQKLGKRAIRGAPDWVAEVLSPSTAKRDQTVKRSVYERAGVKETWFIHPTKRTLALYRLEDGRYADATVLELKGKTTLSAVPGVTIDWDRLLTEVG